MGGERGLHEVLRARVGDDAAARRLARYVALVERWSQTHNLVRFATREELLERHVLEPLSVVGSLAASGRLLDVGSGAGLPGVPLLVLMPGWQGVLLEPRHKRWTFLRLVIRELDLAAEARAVRYQDYDGGGFDLVTARAVGGHAELVHWAREHLNADGKVLLWTGEEEAARLGGLAGWRVLSSPLVGLDRGRLVCLEPCFT